MTNRTDPDTDARPHHDARRLTLAGTHKGEDIGFDMPGWNGDHPDAGVFDAEGVKISGRALSRLKARAEYLPRPAAGNGARIPR